MNNETLMKIASKVIENRMKQAMQGAFNKAAADVPAKAPDVPSNAAPVPKYLSQWEQYSWPRLATGAVLRTEMSNPKSRFYWPRLATGAVLRTEMSNPKSRFYWPRLATGAALGFTGTNFLRQQQKQQQQK